MALEQISSTRTTGGFAKPTAPAAAQVRPPRLLGWLLASLLSLGLWLGLYGLLRVFG